MCSLYANVRGAWELLRCENQFPEGLKIRVSPKRYCKNMKSIVLPRPGSLFFLSGSSWRMRIIEIAYTLNVLITISLLKGADEHPLGSVLLLIRLERTKPWGSGDYTPGAGLKPPPTPTEHTRLNHSTRTCMGGCRCAAAAREARRRARNHGNALQKCSSGWQAHAWTTHACCAHESIVQQHLHAQDESSYASMHANY